MKEFNLEMTREEFREFIEFSRKIKGQKSVNAAQIHLEEYPDCEHKQTFMDGVFFGMKIIFSCMQDADDIEDDNSVSSTEGNKETNPAVREMLDDAVFLTCNTNDPIEDIVDGVTICKSPKQREELIEALTGLRESDNELKSTVFRHALKFLSPILCKKTITVTNWGEKVSRKNRKGSKK